MHQLAKAAAPLAIVGGVTYTLAVPVSGSRMVPQGRDTNPGALIPGLVDSAAERDKMAGPRGGEWAAGALWLVSSFQTFPLKNLVGRIHARQADRLASRSARPLPISDAPRRTPT